MRKNLAAITSNHYVAMEEMDTTQNELRTQTQLENELDTETVLGEMQVIKDSSTALENLIVGLQDLKDQGKGLSLESSRFVQYYLSDIGDKLGTNKKTVSLESFSSDEKRLDMALESAMSNFSSVILSNFTSVGWLVLKLQKYMDDSIQKNKVLKTELENAIRNYEQSGPTDADEITGAFGSSLLKQPIKNPSNSVIASNLKQYADKTDSPIKTESIKTVTEAGKDIVEMIRSNWFFTSRKENHQLVKILEKLKTAIIDYSSTEDGVIGSDKHKLVFNDQGEPSLTRIVSVEDSSTHTFKPLSKNEFQQISKELVRIAQLNIEISETSVKLLDHMKSIMGWSLVNNYLRVGPYITAALATVAATAIAGPAAGYAVGTATGAMSLKTAIVRMPSRDIFQAMFYTQYVNVLHTYIKLDARQRSRIVAEGTMLIKKSTA